MYHLGILAGKLCIVAGNGNRRSNLCCCLLVHQNITTNHLAKVDSYHHSVETGEYCTLPISFFSSSIALKVCSSLFRHIISVNFPVLNFTRSSREFNRKEQVEAKGKREALLAVAISFIKEKNVANR